MATRCGFNFITSITSKSILFENIILHNVTRISRRYEVTLECAPYKLHRIDESPKTSTQLTKEDALLYYEQMSMIRKMEQAASNLYKAKQIRGFCHLYSGQEACAVGAKAAIRPFDSVITAYRAHGWVQLMGSSVLGVLGELTGRSVGCARGKGGSMHMYAHKFYGGNGIVGAQVPLGTGIAMAYKYTGSKGISLTLYGDGAANQGQVFEAFNIAKLWNLPVVYVCENNGYGMGTAAHRAAAVPELYTRGDYIPGIWVDGMDILAVREAIRFGIEWVEAGKGPILFEAATYRYFGHSMSDPGTSYRTREEIQEVRKTRDPITGFKEKILGAGLVTEDDLKKIDKATKAHVDEAAKKSTTEPEPPVEELSMDVVSNSLEDHIRGHTVFDKLPHKNIGKRINLK